MSNADFLSKYCGAQDIASVHAVFSLLATALHLHKHTQFLNPETGTCITLFKVLHVMIKEYYNTYWVPHMLSVFFQFIFSEDQIKKDEIGGACNP